MNTSSFEIPEWRKRITADFVIDQKEVDSRQQSDPAWHSFIRFGAEHPKILATPTPHSIVFTRLVATALEGSSECQLQPDRVTRCTKTGFLNDAGYLLIDRPGRPILVYGGVKEYRSNRDPAQRQTTIELLKLILPDEEIKNKK